MLDEVTGGSRAEMFECLFYCGAINTVVVGQSRTVSGVVAQTFILTWEERRERETVDATESEDNYLDEEIKEIQHSIHC